MPQASKTEHNVVLNTALAYISNESITAADPHWMQGSQNILTSLRNWSENRPGFSALVEKVASNFTNLQRQMIWRRWSGSTPNGGTFVWMGCDVSGGVAKVYKMLIGIDATAQLLWTSASAEPFDFVVSNNTCYFGNGTDMKKFDSATLTNWGIVAPVVGPSIALVVGTNNIFTSWCYCYTYFNSNTNHESSASPISACSGVFSLKNVNLGVTASTDPQVTNIRVYRTPDGGAQDPTQMQEITGSPFPNTTATITDSTLDVNLGIRVAPAFLRNDPPPASKGFVAYSGRIWGFINNTTYYSGFEEIANGVPEECWPSGLAGNYYPWSDEVQGHAPLIDGVAIFLAETVQKVEGDSLDTFRRYALLQKRGTRSRTSISTLGGSVVWLDTSNTIWLSDLGEIGIPIRPDVQAINPATCWTAIHISGTFHWVVVLDGTNGILYVFDLDRQQWLPPWTVGASASALFSGESAVGVVDLLLARNTSKALKLAAGTYTDDTTAYSPVAKTNLYPLTPSGNPSWQGTHDWSEIKTDAVAPSQILQLIDGDPTQDAYTDITANAELSPLLAENDQVANWPYGKQIPGRNLMSWRYPASPEAGAFMSMQYRWAGGTNFKLYQLDDAFHPAGG